MVSPSFSYKEMQTQNKKLEQNILLKNKKTSLRCFKNNVKPDSVYRLQSIQSDEALQEDAFSKVNVEIFIMVLLKRWSTSDLVQTVTSNSAIVTEALPQAEGFFWGIIDKN